MRVCHIRAAPPQQWRPRQINHLGRHVGARQITKVFTCPQWDLALHQHIPPTVKAVAQVHVSAMLQAIPHGGLCWVVTRNKKSPEWGFFL